MAVLALGNAGRPSERPDTNHSDEWPSESTQESPDDHDEMAFSFDGPSARARVLGDGRVDINVNSENYKPHLTGILNDIRVQRRDSLCSNRVAEGDTDSAWPSSKMIHLSLRLNLVIQVIGSRGDIQPFVALGRELKAQGHRVRLATHLAFRQFVLESGLEFFNIGGDPEQLMAFMVKNPGLLPGFKAIRSGDIQKRRREMKEIFNGCWRSCFEKGDGTHLHQIKEDLWSEALDYRQRPFVADVIIANPPSLAHIHCAQRLGIPLHIIFTMPWSPTQSFPHPLANLHSQNCKPTIANFMSYSIMDMMVWEGLGDILNTLRKNTLALQPLDTVTARGILQRLHVPHTYLWSPSLLPKPPDWPDNIDVCGFSFLPSETNYVPSNEITEFLKAGPKPIYIGFGSIVVDNPLKLTKIIFNAVGKTKQRALISKGWGNLGANEVPDNILMIGNCPHDWLFRQVSCVIHHGGAGTTAAGLALGVPTIIVPFFGDQQFWGDIVARAGAGPTPIPYKRLNQQNLSAAIQKALEASTLEKAQLIAMRMQEESGVRHGVNSFYRNLDPATLRCSIIPNQPAAWHLKHTHINLSAFAATVLVKSGKVSPEMLVLHRATEYDTFLDPTDPITASAQVLFGAITGFMAGLIEVPREILSDMSSAVHAIRKPHEHLDHREACRAALSSPVHLTPENTIENEETNTENESAELQVENYGEQREEIPEDESTQEDTGDDANEPHVNDIDRVRTKERNRNLQLEKAKTMSSSMTPSKPPRFPVLHEVKFHGSKASKKMVKLVIWLPTNLSLSMARGFHNAPKLYHDSTVTDVPQVTSLRSGFRAAGKELQDEFSFGIKGLKTHPRDGFKDEGTKGFLKGIGKAMGGVFLKPIAGLWGLAGYPLSGILREVNDSLGRHQKCMIVMGRIAQGIEEMRESTAEEREEVFRKWVRIEHNL
ncbi:CAZyme family GT1 [Penicillium herquei]|nr:CAZyme family GT1 [Penicillium herquei]